MNQEESSPVSTTMQSGGAGFFFGYRNQAGRPFRPSDVPARTVGKTAARVPSGVVYPNGEFSLGWTDVGTAEVPAEFTWGQYLASPPSWELSEWDEQKRGRPWPDAPWLVSAPKSTQRPETYGRKGITGYGKKTVRSACALLQRKYGRKRLSFLTLTVPELAPEALRAVALNWGQITNRLVQWITRRLSKAGLSTSVVLVTECQPRRVESGSLGCLHVHAVFQGRQRLSGDWAIRPVEVREFWLSELSRRVGFQVVSESCEELRMVKKSAEGYLGKYMSKGSESAVLLASKHGWECLPRQWWTATKRAKDAVKNSTFKSQEIGDFLEFLIDSYFNHKEKFPGCLMAHHILLDDRPFLVGFSGRFDRETTRYVLGALGHDISTVDI